MRKAVTVICLSSLLGCSGAQTTRADCDKIEADIRRTAARFGWEATAICVTKDPGKLQKVGEACDALRACNERLANGD